MSTVIVPPTFATGGLPNTFVYLDNANPAPLSVGIFTDTTSTAEGVADFCGAQIFKFYSDAARTIEMTNLITVQSNGYWHIQASYP